MSTFPNIYRNPLWTPPDFRRWGRQFMELLTKGKRQKNSHGRSEKNPANGKVKYNTDTNKVCCCAGSGSGSGTNPYICGVCTTTPVKLLVTFADGAVCVNQCMVVDQGTSSNGPMQVSGSLDGASFCLNPFSPCLWSYKGPSPITTTCHNFNCIDCPRVDNKIQIDVGWNSFSIPFDASNVYVRVRTINETLRPDCNPTFGEKTNGNALLFASGNGFPFGGNVPIPGCNTSFTVTNQITSWMDWLGTTFTSCQTGFIPGNNGETGFMLGGTMLVTPDGC